MIKVFFYELKICMKMCISLFKIYFPNIKPCCYSKFSGESNGNRMVAVTIQANELLQNSLHISYSKYPYFGFVLQKKSPETNF